jgi:glycosyltransferase involved in cell wall biosynthesis
MPLSTSVVLCTFNGARFLAAQWNSLLAQTRPPDEIVVRDDASTDATPALLESLRQRAEAHAIRVQLSINPGNLGYVANFEAALRAATGDVVCLCDQDDVWHPDKLATQVALFERRPELLLTCSDARRVDAAGADLGRSLFEVLRITRAELRAIHRGDGFDVLLRRSLATGATIAMRCELLTAALPFPDGWVHDEWLAVVAAALGGFDCIEAPLIDYRQHAGNEIGMPARGLAARWRDLVCSRAGLFEVLISRDDALARRLFALGAWVPDRCQAQLADKRRYLQIRRGLRGSAWARLPVILRTAIRGQYQRYGSGWHMALRDLLRRE